jgi:hypothetical protein
MTVKVAAYAAPDSHRMKTSPQPPKRKPLRRRGAARVIAETAVPATFNEPDAFIEHPDGWYWAAPDGHQEFGPFGSRDEARADRDGYSEEAPADIESVQDVEREIGVADWIDAETGELAEGQSPPHLEDR